MKKLFAILAFVAFTGVVANAQTSSTDTKAPEKKEQEVKKCTEAERAQCEKDAAKTGAKCETTDAKTEKSCSSGKAGGSCCSKGTTSAGGSCCQKGATGSSQATENAAPAEGKKSKKTKTVAAVTETDKK